MPRIQRPGAIKAIAGEIDGLSRTKAVDQAKAQRRAEIQRRIGTIDTETDRLNGLPKAREALRTDASSLARLWPRS